MMASKLLVARTDAGAKRYAAALDLGDDWMAVGYGAALTGRRFAKAVVFDFGESHQAYVERIVRPHLAVGGELVVI